MKMAMAKFLEDDIVRLRPLELQDVDFIYSIENNTDEWGSTTSCTPCSRYALENYIKNASQDFVIDGQLRLIVERKSDGALLGLIEVFDYNMLASRAELGIIIVEEFRGKAYASAALTLLKDYVSACFRLNQLYVYVRTDNSCAEKLFLKNGFDRAGVLKDWLSFCGEMCDVYVMQCILTK